MKVTFEPVLEPQPFSELKRGGGKWFGQFLPQEGLAPAVKINNTTPMFFYGAGYEKVEKTEPNELVYKYDAHITFTRAS